MQIVSINYEIWQWLLLLIILLPEAVFDIKKQEVHPYLIMAGTLLAAALGKILSNFSLADLILNLLPGLFLILLSILIKDSLGKGDGLMTLFIGQVCGMERTILILVLAFLTAALFGLLLIVTKKVDRKTKLPFIPFITVAALTGGVIL